MIWTIDHRTSTPLRDQIAACVRRALASGELQVGAHLPPPPNWLIRCRSIGTPSSPPTGSSVTAASLEFRRGRGVRVASGAGWDPAVVDAATTLIGVARTHGVGRAELVQLIEELS